MHGAGGLDRLVCGRLSQLRTQSRHCGYGAVPTKGEVMRSEMIVGREGSQSHGKPGDQLALAGTPRARVRSTCGVRPRVLATEGAELTPTMGYLGR